ncbi:MAG TPA: 30S ribosomal protein S8 [Candidatus Paceibacterota bacterium]
MIDPIADMLNRIKTAQAVNKDTLEVPFSAIKYAIAKILERKGFVKSIDFKGKRTKKTIEIRLAYKGKEAKITGLRRVSKPGQRKYASSIDIARVRGGQGFAILSTSKGLMTDSEARKGKVGGEILCELW